MAPRSFSLLLTQDNSSKYGVEERTYLWHEGLLRIASKITVLAKEAAKKQDVFKYKNTEIVYALRFTSRIDS